MNRGAWWATVHRIAKNWTRLGALAHTHNAYPLQSRTTVGEVSDLRHGWGQDSASASHQ